MNITDPDSLEFSVSEEHDGERLDKWLAGCCTSLSRTQIRREITAGNVWIDGKRTKPSYRLAVDEQVRCAFQLPTPAGPQPEPMELSVLYEDEALAVIDKPAAMVVHPAKGHWQGTLVSGLANHFDTLSSVGESVRPGIVHRLDRDTTGVIVIAKTDEGASNTRSPNLKIAVLKSNMCVCV